jgi:hypothetical protein
VAEASFVALQKRNTGVLQRLDLRRETSCWRSFCAGRGRSRDDRAFDEAFHTAYGTEASADFDQAQEGIVAASGADPKVADAPIVIFGLHELQRTDTKPHAHVVVQIRPAGGEDLALKQRGCMRANARTSR